MSKEWFSASFGLKLLMIGLMVVTCGLIWYFRSPPGIMESSVSWQEGDGLTLYTIETPSFSEMRDGQIQKSFAAKRFVINKRSFLALQVQSIHEALFEAVHVRLYRYTQAGEGAPATLIGDFGEMIKLSTGPKGGGQTFAHPSGVRITQIIMEPFVVDILLDQVPQIHLEARHALVDPDRGQIRMTAATMKQLHQNKTIVSETVFWDEAKQVFEIPGRYYAESPKGHAMAQGLQVGLDFLLKAL
ncbi:MAG: hypothetical protein H7839_22760 [Magnetococcus sp. YQC-5]